MSKVKREEIDRLTREISNFLEKWGLDDCYALYYNQHAEVLTLKFDSYLYDFFMEDMFTAKASNISKEAQQILESKLNIGTEVNPWHGGFFYNIGDLEEEVEDEINDNPPLLDFADFDSMDEYNEFLDEVNYEESKHITWDMKNYYGQDGDLQRELRKTIFKFVKQEFKELFTPYNIDYILDPN